MSTKKLARTVIEPGRANFTKFERRTENRCDRRATHMLAHALLRDPERRHSVNFPRRQPIRIHQQDKLSPLERWIRKQKDRPWGEVYAEIKSRCDARTTPGRHILYDHLLGGVEGNGITRESPNRWRGRYGDELFVDGEGILRHTPPIARTRYESYWWRPKRQDVIAAFVMGRRVRALGAAFFWMVRVNECTRCYDVCIHLHFRQDVRLDENEVATWRAFGERVRQPHTWTG